MSLICCRFCQRVHSAPIQAPANSQGSRNTFLDPVPCTHTRIGLEVYLQKRQTRLQDVLATSCLGVVAEAALRRARAMEHGLDRVGCLSSGFRIFCSFANADHFSRTFLQASAMALTSKRYGQGEGICLLKVAATFLSHKFPGSRQAAKKCVPGFLPFPCSAALTRSYRQVPLERTRDLWHWNRGGKDARSRSEFETYFD